MTTRTAQPRQSGSWIAFACVDAILIGVAVALVDMIFICVRTSGQVSVSVLAIAVASLDLILGLTIGLLVLVIGHTIAVSSLASAIRTRLRSDDRRRALAIVWCASLALVVSVTWLLAVAVTVWAGAAFHNPRNAAIVTATSILGFAALFAGISALASPLLERAASLSVVRRLISSKLVLGFVVIAVPVCGVLGIQLLATWLGSDSAAPTAWFAVFAASMAIIAVRPAGRARRIYRRGLIALAGALVIAGLFVLSSTQNTRRVIGESGLASRVVMKQLVRLTDRDHDGFTALLGGADCDDASAATSPLTHEIAGNGIDDNCIGGDGVVADQAYRRSRHASIREPRSLDVILITIDTLRPDHLSLYGYKRNTSPYLDVFSREAAVFERAETASPMTRRALPALLFGRYSSTLPFEPPDGLNGPVLRENRFPTLAMELQRTGYQTHVIFALDGILQPAWLHGFLSQEAVSRDPHSASKVTDAAIRWLAQPSTSPRFTWVHYFDAHHPYVQAPQVRAFGTSDVDRYDSQIEAIDREIGRLFDTLTAQHKLETTVIVITADHGEGFGEHGDRYHGRNLNEEQTHIPLIISVPGIAGHRIEGPVSIVDIAPTILDLLGRSQPAGMNGHSLLPLVLSGSASEETVLCELLRDGMWVERDRAAELQGTTKTIWDMDANAFQIFDLARDPQESHPKPADRETIRRFGAVMDAELGTVDLPEDELIPSLEATTLGAP